MANVGKFKGAATITVAGGRILWPTGRISIRAIHVATLYMASQLPSSST